MLSLLPIIYVLSILLVLLTLALKLKEDVFLQLFLITLHKLVTRASLTRVLILVDGFLLQKIAQMEIFVILELVLMV
jgi:hypothetical protein